MSYRWGDGEEGESLSHLLPAQISGEVPPVHYTR